ncbi:hypothetical protein GDO86_020552 [Hymenochirus boettgeri]|uniref:Uncharacterized protein n=1 Tax=Hymenochirus boettgeri TaxID=247094 RepID=A0A8T2IFD0_9PIPI|nr:hypothetical protein GDO86_020552 [Hymenochirus boettgeri]
MLGRRPGKKTGQGKGKGAAAAKELGLFVDFNPEDMMLGIPDDPDDRDLEAELAALTGEKLKTKQKIKAPLPMEDIERMAQDCMRNSDEEDDEDLEGDEDLLAELQEVVGEEEWEPSHPKSEESFAPDLIKLTDPAQELDTHLQVHNRKPLLI